MFTVIRKSCLYLETIKNAALDQKGWSFDFACSDKIRPVRKTVMEEVGLPK